MTEQANAKKEKTTVKHKVMTAIGIILCVMLIPILTINITLIVKSHTNPDEVPSINGTMPFIVLTDSMYPVIQSGDLIICHTEDTENIENGDVIAFFDPAGTGQGIVTHRVIEITEKDGGLAFKTQGDANNVADAMLVPASKVVGVFEKRIPNLGNAALFMQTTQGLIICVVIPIILLVGYDLLRRRIYDKKKNEDTKALLAELEALKAANELPSK